MTKSMKNMSQDEFIRPDKSYFNLHQLPKTQQPTAETANLSFHTSFPYVQMIDMLIFTEKKGETGVCWDKTHTIFANPQALPKSVEHPLHPI